VGLLPNNSIIKLKKAGIFRPFLYTVFIIVMSSCALETEQKEMRYDYFRGKSSVKYATGFKVAYYPSYKVVEVFDNTDTTKPAQTYLLVEHGTRIPEHSPKDILVRIPLVSVSCLSTTHVPYLKSLEQVEKISGIGNPELVLDTMLLKQIKKGWTMSITTSGQVDLEKILESNTSVLMAYPFDKSALESLSGFDIPVVYVGEYLENSVLARAEWIKFFALFFNKEKMANQLFEDIEHRYLIAKSKLDSVSVSKAPTVFFGSYYQDVWFAPGGQSLISGLINDAGASYLFRDDNSTKNLTLDSEVIIDEVPEIDFWGQVITTHEIATKTDFMAADQRFLKLAKKSNTQFFFANSKQSDYFGQANLEPDILLKDLGNIFYPGLFANHHFVYFQPLN